MKYDYKRIWSISFPILAGLLIQQIIGMTDAAFLGRVGEIELGASALAGVFYIMIYMLGQGFGTGVQIIAARRNGETRFEKIGPLIYQGISFLTAAAAVIIILSSVFSPFILKSLISSSAVYDKVRDYLDIRIYGFVFAFLTVMFRAYFVAITQTKILTRCALLMLAINTLLDYLLIFGKFGFPKMGIAGAALASVAAEAAAAVFFVFYLIFKTDLKKYGFNNFVIYDKLLLAEIFGLSIWTMLQYFISLATWFLFLLAMEHLGETPLAVSNILRSVSSLPFMIATALGSAANAITGNLIGSGQDYLVTETSAKIIRLGYLIGLGTELLMALFPVLFLRIYTDNAVLINASLPPYYAMLTTYLTLVPGMIWLNTVSGSGDTRQALLMEVGALSVYMLNVWYVAVFLKADIAICWTCEHSYNIVIMLLTYLYLRRNNWCCKIV